MLQYPSNVNLQNKTIDATAQTIGRFTFYGDRLTGFCCRIIDYDTNNVALDNYYDRIQYSTYNGDGDSFVIDPNVLENGHNYILEMLLTQRKENEELIYDMPVTGGTVRYTESLTMFIEESITGIYPWAYGNDVRTPAVYNDTTVAEMIIKIGNETRKIVSYNPYFDTGGSDVYGEITLDTAFSQTVVGKKYEIYSNHIITPQYFFKCRSTPSVSLAINVHSDVRIHVDGEYSQAQDTGIKYYTLALYWSNNQNFRNETVDNVNYITELVDETKRRYSQKIEADFGCPYRHDEEFNNNESPDYYKVVCNLLTNDNVEYSAESAVLTLDTITAKKVGDNLYDFTLEYDSERGRVLYKLRGYGSAGQLTDVHQYNVFRKDMSTGEIIQLPHNHLREEQHSTGYYNITVSCDATASINSQYRYAVRGIGLNGNVIIPHIETNPESPDYYKGIGKFPCNDIVIKDYAYFISDLNYWYEANEKTWYQIGDTWKFIGEISDTTVVNNLDRQLHTNYSQYTSLTSTETNYMTGTLSAMLGYINCANHEYIDNIALVKAWRKFITQPKPFLLKSQKGDVWVVNITDNPQTEYQENAIPLPTRFTFSWAETCSVNDIKIVDFYGRG